MRACIAQPIPKPFWRRRCSRRAVPDPRQTTTRALRVPRGAEAQVRRRPRAPERRRSGRRSRRSRAGPRSGLPDRQRTTEETAIWEPYVSRPRPGKPTCRSRAARGCLWAVSSPCSTSRPRGMPPARSTSCTSTQQAGSTWYSRPTGTSAPRAICRCANDAMPRPPPTISSAGRQATTHDQDARSGPNRNPPKPPRVESVGKSQGGLPNRRLRPHKARRPGGGAAGSETVWLESPGKLESAAVQQEDQGKEEEVKKVKPSSCFFSARVGGTRSSTKGARRLKQSGRGSCHSGRRCQTKSSLRATLTTRQ